LFRYSVADGLSCVSCDPGGAPPSGDAYLQGPALPVSLPAAHQTTLTHNLSDDGGRVFFASADPLVPADTNAQLDVYEWEAMGDASCQVAGGCLSLISSGQSPGPSTFADAGAEGADAFFFTVDQLVGQDRDLIVDVYDARVGGGLAAQNPPPEQP